MIVFCFDRRFREEEVFKTILLRGQNREWNKNGEKLNYLTIVRTVILSNQNEQLEMKDNGEFD